MAMGMGPGIGLGSRCPTAFSHFPTFYIVVHSPLLFAHNEPTPITIAVCGPGGS